MQGLRTWVLVALLSFIKGIANCAYDLFGKGNQIVLGAADPDDGLEAKRNCHSRQYAGTGI